MKRRFILLMVCIFVQMGTILYAIISDYNMDQHQSKHYTSKEIDFSILKNCSSKGTVLETSGIKIMGKNKSDPHKRTLLTKCRTEVIEKLYGHSVEKAITTFSTRFLIYGDEICNDLHPPFLLVIVLSPPTNKEERQAIRQTWGSVIKKSKPSFNISVQIMFLVGRSKMTANMGLQEESDTYKDVVQIDLIESRYNLTRKVITGLKWVNMYCGSVKYIMKSDDDTFINVDRLSRYLLTNSNINNETIYGFVYEGGIVQRHGKYRVRESEFPLSHFPPCTMGSAYILPVSILSDMLDMAEMLPYCPIEDAFLTGILRIILGFKIQHSSDFTYMGEMKVNPCRFHSKISVTNIDPICMYKLWNITTQTEKIDCKQRAFYNKDECKIFE